VTGHDSAIAARVRENRRGVTMITAAMACFIVNDTMVKYASESLPAAQLIFIRSVMATAIIFAIVVATGRLRQIHAITHRWVLTRSILDAASTFLYLVSLFHLPISTATSINSTSPLMLTVAAALVIGERVRAALWFATAIGFLGVLLIVQPQTQGFNGYALVCLASAVVMVFRDIVTRRVHAGVPSLVVTLSTTITVTLLAGTASLIQGWGPVSVRSLGLLAFASIAISVAYVLVVRGTRRGDLSVVIPFRYSALPFAAIAGYLIWGDIPNALAWCGIALLVGSGIYVLRADRRARTGTPTID
jgi:drug/metabolite transporter (DMT)-like permease